ncbi:MAG: hypothetical protein GY816_06860 [Cytophagales bacterium]|nr:hypothetical protein [Cytophagales bacterium]
MKNLIKYLLLLAIIPSCSTNEGGVKSLNDIAIDYVRLGLEIGEYDPAFVDAYYGPDSLKFSGTKLDSLPKEDFLKRVADLKSELTKVSSNSNSTDDEKLRSNWMFSQLTAFDRRIRIASGDLGTFDEEAEDLFGVKIPSYDSTHFIRLIAELDTVLPGEGTLDERKAALTSKFTIPEDRIDTVFMVAIEAARKITQERFDLPEGETFTLEYVRDKTWSGYNWYQGNYKSLIQINLDRPILVDRVIDLACHEGYPGHHVYNMMLEKNLYADKGWVEISLYPLFSPMSLIAEGSANYGIEMAFPGESYNKFAKEVLLPIAGLDTTGADAYFKYISIKSKLNYARNEAARGIINGTMTEAEYTHWLEDFAMINSSVPFIKAYRSYMVNYNYGKDLVKNYVENQVESQSSSDDDRWEAFDKLLSNPVMPKELLEE